MADFGQRAVLSEGELAVFVQKLDIWAASLADNERVFLHQLLADAADASNDDASGFANLTSIVTDDVSGYNRFGGIGGAVAAYAEGISSNSQSSMQSLFDED